ncbi:MAG: glycosyltransferase family 2 protein [Candidatus Brocadiae bacterium]|nr:glycosyltransferase family 2 protein [Candidatus Brocadiia bacterium]
MPEISVVLPIYNEKGNIENLVQEIIAAIEPLSKPFEILCVDDGSKDGSLETILALCARDARIQALSHERNFGQSAAQASGFGKARGSILVTLDADGQNNPADIPRLLSFIGEYDCACGIRGKRRDTWVRKLSSRIANRVRNWITGDSIQDSGCTLRAIRKDCLKEIPIFNGMHRFLPSLLRFKGKKVIEIPVDHRERTWGESKYGIRNRAFRGLIDTLAIRWWKARSFPQERLRKLEHGRH